jgi:hypothetical protein
LTNLQQMRLESLLRLETKEEDDAQCLRVVLQRKVICQ